MSRTTNTAEQYTTHVQFVETLEHIRYPLENVFFDYSFTNRKRIVNEFI